MSSISKWSSFLCDFAYKILRYISLKKPCIYFTAKMDKFISRYRFRNFNIVLKISCYIRKHNKDFQLGPYIVQCPIYTRSFQSPHLFYRSYLVNQCNSICHSSLWYFFVALKQLIPSLYIQFVFWSSEGIVLGTINCVNHSIFFSNLVTADYIMILF